MLNKALWRSRKLPSQLLGELGGIAKVSIIDVNVLRDFDASANSVCGLPLVHPDWLEQSWM
jgi:hypothetical protein